MAILTQKEAIAAFYRKLYLDQPYTDQEVKAAAERLGIVRWLFMLKYGLTENHISEDRGVPEALGFLGVYICDKWFPAHREELEKKTLGYLVGKVDLEFKSYLRHWWDREKKLRKAEAVAYGKDSDGNMVPDYTEPEPEVRRIVSRRKVKSRLLYRCMQQLKDKGDKRSKGLLNIIKQELKRRAECKGDPEEEEALKRWKVECQKVFLWGGPHYLDNGKALIRCSVGPL